MTCPPYLTRVERIVAEKVLRAVGYCPEQEFPDEWIAPGQRVGRIDLAEVFHSPVSAQERDPGPPCPVHGEGA